MNKVLNDAKRHWASYASYKEQFTFAAYAHARKQLKPIDIADCPVDFWFHWVVRDRRIDKDNIAANKKVILDGLVGAGIIENDGWKCVGDFHDRFSVDKDEPRVEVILDSSGGG